MLRESFPDAPPPLPRVLHQCISLDIFPNKFALKGWTSLCVVAPDFEKGQAYTVGLHHGSGLTIERVEVAGKPVDFHLKTPEKPVWTPDPADDTLVSCRAMADKVYYEYWEQMEEHQLPTLAVVVPYQDPAASCPATAPASTPPAAVNVVGGGDQSAPLVTLNVRVYYHLHAAKVGVHFMGHYMHVNGMEAGGRAWFPCVDVPESRCKFELRVTTQLDHVAVASGALAGPPVLSERLGGSKTYSYSLQASAPCSHLALAVGPFTALPDPRADNVTHFAPPELFDELKTLAQNYNVAFGIYEDYLQSNFPYPALQQVFVDPESAVCSVYAAASCNVISAHLLPDQEVLEGGIECRVRSARALAQQWFGNFLIAETPSDLWLVDGLASYMTDLYVTRLVGASETAWRRYCERKAVCAADNGMLPPLHPRDGRGWPPQLKDSQFFINIKSWKSKVVLLIFEQHMGADAFRKVLQQMLQRAKMGVVEEDAGPGAGDELASQPPQQQPMATSAGVCNGQPQRLISTAIFLRLCRKVGGLQNAEVAALAERCIYGSGCPTIKLAFTFNQTRNVIELALQQEGSVAAANSAAAAVEAGGKKGFGGNLRVLIHEKDGPHDRPLSMSREAYQLVEVECKTKPPSKKTSRYKKAGEKKDGEDLAGDGLAAAVPAGPPTYEMPILYIRCDPDHEWLANVQVQQPEQMWITQLEKETSVHAQADAVAALARLCRTSFSAIQALRAFLEDPKKGFCRVRGMAAQALADNSSATTNWMGLDIVMKFYRDTCFDPLVNQVRPNDFSDMAEHYVRCAILEAAAGAVEEGGHTPSEVVEFLVGLLKYNNNAHNPWDDSALRCSLVGALGITLPATTKLLCKVVKTLMLAVARDAVMPSFQNSVTCTALKALGSLSVNLRQTARIEGVGAGGVKGAGGVFNPEDAQHVLGEAMPAILARYAAAPNFFAVRLAAHSVAARLELGRKGWLACLQYVLKAVKCEKCVRVRAQLLWEVAALMHNKAVLVAGDVQKQLPQNLLQALRECLVGPEAGEDPKLQHAAFALLQRLGQRPPTLHRTLPDRPIPPEGFVTPSQGDAHLPRKRRRDKRDGDEASKDNRMFPADSDILKPKIKAIRFTHKSDVKPSVSDTSQQTARRSMRAPPKARVEENQSTVSVAAMPLQHHPGVTPVRSARTARSARSRGSMQSQEPGTSEVQQSGQKRKLSAGEPVVGEVDSSLALATKQQEHSVEPNPAAPSQPPPPVARLAPSVQDPIQPPPKKIKIRVGLLKVNPSTGVPSASVSASDAPGGGGVSTSALEGPGAGLGSTIENLRGAATSPPAFDAAGAVALPSLLKMETSDCATRSEPGGPPVHLIQDKPGQEQATVQPKEPASTPAQSSIPEKVAPAGFAFPENKPHVGGLTIRIKQSSTEAQAGRTVPHPQTSDMGASLIQNEDPGTLGVSIEGEKKDKKEKKEKKDKSEKKEKKEKKEKSEKKEKKDKKDKSEKKEKKDKKDKKDKADDNDDPTRSLASQPETSPRTQGARSTEMSCGGS